MGIEPAINGSKPLALPFGDTALFTDFFIRHGDEPYPLRDEEFYYGYSVRWGVKESNLKPYPKIGAILLPMRVSLPAHKFNVLCYSDVRLWRTANH